MLRRGRPSRSVRHADGRFTVSLTDAGGTAVEGLGSERLLVAAGRRPNIPDLGLDTVGLDPQARSVETDARMRAGDKVWAIGDITGKGAFTHMSMYEAERSPPGRHQPGAPATTPVRPSTTPCRG